MRNKGLILMTFALLSLTTSSYAQTQNDKPYIEVTGTAEKEVVPDEIYISITLAERYDGRNKVTIDEQEQQLRASIKKLGIDMSNLSLSNADASYVRVNWFNKDVLAKKNYMLKVNSAEMVSKVFQELADLNIKDASVSRVEYSKEDQLKKELRIAAVRDAKDKAGYMLEAIGQTAGKPLYINEQEIRPVMYSMAMQKANVAMQGDNTTSTDDNYIEFKKTKYTMNVNARFEIK